MQSYLFKFLCILIRYSSTLASIIHFNRAVPCVLLHSNIMKEICMSFQMVCHQGRVIGINGVLWLGVTPHYSLHHIL